MNSPTFPIYIVSKGRWDSRLTSKTLERMKVPYHIVVEEQQYAHYRRVIERKKILVLDTSYQQKYDTLDDLGDSKSKGPGPARNFAWDHSISNGHTWHWVLDDNIDGFMRLNHNRKITVKTGGIFTIAENFVLRFANVSMAGFHYDYFAKGKQKLPPFYFNSRIYSCNLIRNDVPYRWRGRYNEDTDLSLRMLKDRWVTVLFLAFLQNKSMTQTVKGGCDADFYSKEGTLPKSQMLVRMHPDVSRLAFKFGRWHHHIDYRPFKYNRPQLIAR